jgi:hypothetical protein
MNYEALENNISGQVEPVLVRAIPTLRVETEPEIEGENLPIITDPRVTIFLDQSEFNKTKNTHYIVQDEDIKVFLLVRARKLRGDGGVYQILELIRKALVGYIPEGFTKIWLVKIAFEKHERGIWNYTVVIGMNSLIAEETNDELPVLTAPTADFVDTNYNN